MHLLVIYKNGEMKAADGYGFIPFYFDSDEAERDLAALRGSSPDDVYDLKSVEVLEDKAESVYQKKSDS